MGQLEASFKPADRTERLLPPRGAPLQLFDLLHFYNCRLIPAYW